MSSIIDDEVEQKAEEERAAKIAGLRAFADFLEGHPDAELPTGSFYALEYLVSREELVVRAKALGGRWQKVESGGHFELHRHFGGDIFYNLFTDRAQVCDAVIIGQETPTIEAVDPVTVRLIFASSKTGYPL
jgi:hypothetical protein